MLSGRARRDRLGTYPAAALPRRSCGQNDARATRSPESPYAEGHLSSRVASLFGANRPRACGLEDLTVSLATLEPRTRWCGGDVDRASRGRWGELGTQCNSRCLRPLEILAGLFTVASLRGPSTDARPCSPKLAPRISVSRPPALCELEEPLSANSDPRRTSRVVPRAPSQIRLQPGESSPCHLAARAAFDSRDQTRSCHHPVRGDGPRAETSSVVLGRECTFVPSCRALRGCPFRNPSRNPSYRFALPPPIVAPASDAVYVGLATAFAAARYVRTDFCHPNQPAYCTRARVLSLEASVLAPGDDARGMAFHDASARFGRTVRAWARGFRPGSSRESDL